MLPRPLSCKEQLSLHLLRENNSKIILVCICICYEMPNYIENQFSLSEMPFGRTVNRNAALLCLVSEIASDFWGPRWTSQSQKSLRFRCAKVFGPFPTLCQLGVTERAPWRSSQRVVAGVSNVFEIPIDIGCNFFAYSWKLPAYSGAFLLTIDSFIFHLQLELLCIQL